MNIKFLNQPKEIKLGEILINKLESYDFSKIWIFAGFVKDSGLEYLFPSIEKARKNNIEIKLVIGTDNKNTSKDMLLRLLKIGCEIYFFKNNENAKVETRLFALEGQDESYVYLTGGKLSEGGLLENISIVTEIQYLKEDKKEFNKVKQNIESSIGLNSFKKLDEKILKEMAASGEILARIIERKIPTISELYSNGKVSVGIQEYNENTVSEYNKLVDEDFDIDIDFSTSNVKIQKSLGKEVEQSLKKEVKEEIKEEKVQSKIIKNDNVDLFSNMNSLILPIYTYTIKGTSAGEIRIPMNLFINLNMFLDYPDEFHIETNEKGKIIEKQKIDLKIFENKTQKEVNTEAYIIKTDKSAAIYSDKFLELDINENDIMRLIKEEKGKYSCEIIKQDTSEYNVWENFCVNTIKGTKKKFGIQ